MSEVSAAIRLEREKRKTARQAAVLQLQRDALRDLTQVVTDPLWSSILGFVAVHELRQANLVGPVADDMLYGGIIAINTARSGVAREVRQGAVGLADAYGKVIGGATDIAGLVAGMV